MRTDTEKSIQTLGKEFLMKEEGRLCCQKLWGTYIYIYISNESYCIVSDYVLVLHHILQRIKKKKCASLITNVLVYLRLLIIQDVTKDSK
jgi:hypothetical protein